MGGATTGRTRLLLVRAPHARDPDRGVQAPHRGDQDRHAILAPEHIPGGIYARADWVLQKASNMLRIGYFEGGITGCRKLATIAETFGIQCEMHGGGWPIVQVLGSTQKATCEYYERGLLQLDLEPTKYPSPISRSCAIPWMTTGTSCYRRVRAWAWSSTGIISTATWSTCR